MKRKSKPFFSFSLLKPQEKLLIFLIAGGLIALSFNHPLFHHGESFLLKASEKMLSTLHTVTELKSLATATASSRIPLISGAADSISQTLENIFNYLILANIFVLIQIVLVGLSQLLFIKLGAIIALLLAFIKKTHKLALRIFVVFIFINPGMPLYFSGLKIIADHTHLHLLDTFHQELIETKEEFDKKHLLRVQHEEQLKKENLIEKIGLGLVHAVEGIAEHIIRDLKFFTEFTKKVGIELIKKSIKILVANLILFLLLPLLYMYIFLLLLNKIFNFPLDKEHLNELIEKI